MQPIETNPEATAGHGAANTSPEPGKPAHIPSLCASFAAAPLAAEVRQRVAFNIRRLADGRDLSIGDLSQASGVSQRELTAVLAKSVAPTLDWLCRVAVALGVDPIALIASNGAVQPPRRSRRSAASPETEQAEFMLDISVR